MAMYCLAPAGAGGLTHSASRAHTMKGHLMRYPCRGCEEVVFGVPEALTMVSKSVSLVAVNACEGSPV
jgi:hypothetical protein